MQQRSGPIYQLRLVTGEANAAEVDKWLEKHVRDTLRRPGFIDCNAFAASVDNPDQAGRICQYKLTSDDILDEYLDSAAADVEADLVQRFGTNVEFSDHVLREDHSHELADGQTSNCLNCGYHLRGQYCGHCGQRSRSRLISLWELVTDAFGDLFELDSRLWKTIVPLIMRPGRLTHDYLQGRRARYMPPFRMYLVMSLLFFVIAFFNPREELSLFFEPPASTQGEPNAADEGGSADTDEVESDEVESNDSATIEIEPDDLDLTGTDADRPLFVFRDNDEDGSFDESDECNEIGPDDVVGLPPFFARRLTPERLQQVCLHVMADKGKSVVEKVIGNVPTALILLLPLMALVLKALYPLSRRYYVEHLLFFVHLHAFLFLLLTLQILFARAATLLAAPDLVPALTIFLTSLYAPVYLFVAMRRVYGQGRFVTFLKYIVLTVAYFIGFITIMTLTFLLAAFSI